MPLDTRWKNPQGKDPEQLWRWAQDLIAELRKGDYLGGAIPGTGISNAQLADMAAWTIKMRNAGTTGDPQDVTINGLTEETSIDGAADFLPLWDTSGGVMRKAKPSSIANPAPIAAGAIAGGTTNLDIALGSSYDMVEIDLIALEPSNDIVELYSRFSQDGGSSYLSGGSDYAWGRIRANAIANDEADSEITLLDAVGNAVDERVTFTVRIFRPAASSFSKQMTWWGGSKNNAAAHNSASGYGQLIANTNAITHVRFFFSAGTYDAGFYAARGYRFS